jgi:Fur family ferric uptake transcriptional regulator
MKGTQTFNAVLRTAGLKSTATRLAVLGVLTKETRPRSAQYIANTLKGSVDTVTIYRTLESLTESLLTYRTDFQHGHAEYELAINRPHHHHLVCTECGIVEDVVTCPTATVEKKIIKNSKQFSAIESHALEFFGRCINCALT